MTNRSNRRAATHSSLSVLAFAFIGTLPATAMAQSTPSELSDLSLEDLLNMDITDGKGATAGKRWSFGYSYRHLSVGQYQIGTNDVTFDDVLFSPGETRTNQNYPVVPTFIDQHVHAFSATYAVSNSISVSVQTPFISQSTDHISSVPGFSDFRLSTSGIGDITASASYQIQTSEFAALKGSFGLRIPTGSINETGDTPRNGSGTLERLPYTMQLGSGTTDVAMSVHYSQNVGDFRFGASAYSTIRTGMNENGYRLGNNHGAAIWAQYSKNHWIQPGMRISFRHIGEIRGRDDLLLIPGPFPFPASITDPTNYGGEKLYAAANIKTCPTSDCQFFLTAEAGKPVIQNLNGVQPKERYNFSVSATVQF